MLLSIIIPIFNKQTYIRKCIDSILNSGCNNYEILLIDDGSTDDSLNICIEYSHNFNNVITIHQDNQGVSVARITGIMHAQGKYITFVDADDFVKNTYGAQIIEALKKDADYTIFDFTRWIDDEHQQVNGLSIKEGYYKDTLVLTRQVAGLEHCVLSACEGIFKTEIIRTNKINFKAGMKTCEDFHFVLQYIAKIKNLYVSNLAAYCYCYNPNSVTGKRPLSHADDYECVYTQAKSYLKQNNASIAQYVLFYERWTRWCLDLVDNWKRQSFSKEVIWKQIEGRSYYQAVVHEHLNSKKACVEQYLLKYKMDVLIYIYLYLLRKLRTLRGEYRV